ncbi:hypothetical protein [Streptomyces sp. NPDC056723]|uniref:hypothetical protein n=1 Tax=Streptomyces sp. NPDC056723 TaxID=3345925 RepID=UPI003699B9C8
MSPYLFSGTGLTSASEEPTPKPLSLEERFVAEWMAARADRDSKRIESLRMLARSVDRQLPTLADELDGFDYPAAA